MPISVTVIRKHNRNDRENQSTAFDTFEKFKSKMTTAFILKTKDFYQD